MRVAYVSVSDGLGGSEWPRRDDRGDSPGPTGLAAVSRSAGRGPLLERLSAAGASSTSCRFRSHSPVPASPRSSMTRPGRWASFGLSLLRAGAVMPAYRAAARREIDRIAPDIVHTNGLKAHVIGARTVRRVPLVWHMHEYVGRRPLTRALLRRHIGRTSAMVANSASVAADVEQALKPSPAVRVIHIACRSRGLQPRRILGGSRHALRPARV